MAKNQRFELPLPPKNFWLSKLNWVGILTFVVSALQFLTKSDFIINNPQAVAVMGAVIGIVTVLLRYVTYRPVTTPTGKTGTNTEYLNQG